MMFDPVEDARISTARLPVVAITRFGFRGPTRSGSVLNGFITLLLSYQRRVHEIPETAPESLRDRPRGDVELAPEVFERRLARVVEVASLEGRQDGPALVVGQAVLLASL